MPAPGEVICGDLRLTAASAEGLGARVFGEVWLGQRDADDDPLWLTLVDAAMTPTPMNVSTFMAGANAMLRLRHPALVRLRLVDREADYAVVGYEALPGAIPIATLIDSAACSDLVQQTAVEVARGLAALHRAELLHGALSPGSVVMWEGTPVLWQYGIAALCAPPVLGPRSRQLGGDPVAPEVPSGVQLTPAADVYAWGAVLAAMLTQTRGAEAVVAVLEGELPASAPSGLVALVREALSPASAGRPRDGMHLLERLLALPPQPVAPPSSRNPSPSGDFTDLAREYLSEMSEVERRGSDPIATEARADSEASGSLARVKLKKARVSTGSQKIVGFVPDVSESSADALTPPDGTPLWMAASPSQPPRGDAMPPAEAAVAAIETGDDPGDDPGDDTEALEDAALAEAFADLTAAASAADALAPAVAPGSDAPGDRQRHPDRAGLGVGADADVLASVPDDPSDAARPEPPVMRGEPTPVPTRVPNRDERPRTGGWMRAAAVPDDPAAAVQTQLPPARVVGDGVKKRTLAPEEPRASSVAAAADPDDAALDELRGMLKAASTAPRDAGDDDDNDDEDEDERSGRQALIAADVLADLQRDPDELGAGDAGGLGPAEGEAEDEDSSRDLPVASLSSDEAPVRARPVAPFVAPRTPGPHGPPASLLAGAVGVLVAGLAVAGTMAAAQQRGGMQRVLFGAPATTTPEPASAARGVRAPGTAAAEDPACPPGTTALPHAKDPAANDDALVVCIDRYELVGTGDRPAVGLTLADAEQRCEARGRRLCTQAEWTLACAGPGGHPYPYGALPRREACNAAGRRTLAAGGAHPECVTPQGAFDLLGNAAEWVAEGVALGGSFGTRKATCQSAVRPTTRASRAAVGTRCCVDVVP